MKKLTLEERKLHENFQQFGKNAREWMRKCVLMLPEIEEHGIWEKKGFKSITHYAAMIAGMGHKLTINGLRILKKTKNMPNIRAIIEKRGIGIILPIENLLTEENEKEWAERAAKMSCATLAMFVREVRKLDTFEDHVVFKNVKNPHQQATLILENENQNLQMQNFEQTQNLQLQTFAPDSNTQQQPTQKPVLMYIDSETLAQLEKLKGDNDWNLFNERIFTPAHSRT